MKVTWKTWAYGMGIIVISLIAIGIGYWFYGNDELWHDQGRVDWISGQQFTSGVLGYNWINNFSIATLHHGVLNFTTASGNQLSICQTPGYCQGSQGGFKVGGLYGLVKHRNGNVDLVVG